MPLMSLRQSNVCLVSALCIGSLISIIRAAPILPSYTDPLHPTTKSPLWRFSPQTMPDDEWIPTGSTFYENSVTKAPPRSAFAAYINANRTQFVEPITLKVWPSHIDRVKLEPFWSTILERNGESFTTAMHPSLWVRQPNIYSNSELLPRPNTKVQRPLSSSIPLGSSSPSVPSDEAETKPAKRRSKKRFRGRVSPPLGSVHPGIKLKAPETREIGVTAAMRNPDLVLVDLGLPSTKDSQETSQSEGAEVEAVRHTNKMRLRGRKHSRRKQRRRKPVTKGNVSKPQLKRKMSVPMELTLPMKYLMRDAGKTTLDFFVHTDPPVWLDTRYHFQQLSQMPRLRIESNPMVEYYPDEAGMDEVCRDESTIIGTDIVTSYIKPHIYPKPYTKRILYTKFRDIWGMDPILMFCHHPENVPVLKFLKCAIMRHKMMESMLPKYPYHQVQT
ncbi:uncharacterized protein LOC117583668 [Drosophila guanche]|uniref:Uncharacterized protein n=1 Tax=Drosophila guanche TaxID=7266 RepID=A0A3B0JJR0_DROGU|nr:uncharacterized protein LOC117583668 [Drosophila guanche]SPP81023.1 Hypothetical predicted protein [Drosophila guanche]